MMSIAVFEEDEALFRAALARLDKRVRSYYYLAADGGPAGVPPIAGDNGNLTWFWSNPSKPWTNGLNQETRHGL